VRSCGFLRQRGCYRRQLRRHRSRIEVLYAHALVKPFIVNGGSKYSYSIYIQLHNNTKIKVREVSEWTKASVAMRTVTGFNLGHGLYFPLWQTTVWRERPPSPDRTRKKPYGCSFETLPKTQTLACYKPTVPKDYKKKKKIHKNLTTANNHSCRA
jgi:hypothetical protein